MEFTVRQEEIILKSMEIIAREGIAALTIKNISGKVGVSEAALYRHFKIRTRYSSPSSNFSKKVE